MPYIHQEIWENIRMPIEVLVGDFLILVLILLEIWAVIKLTELLFSNQPRIIRVLVSISDVGVLIIFARYTIVPLL